MSEKLLATGILSLAAVTSCTHGPKLPSVNSVQLNMDPPRDAVAFCYEAADEQMPADEVFALSREVRFRIDGVIVDVTCFFADQGPGKEPRLTIIDVREIDEQDHIIRTFVDEFSFEDKVPDSSFRRLPSSMEPDGCVDVVELDLGSRNSRRLNAIECPPYSRPARNQSALDVRNAQHRYSQIMSGARNLIRQLLPRSRTPRRGGR